MGQEGAKDRLNMISRESNLGQEGAKDRLNLAFKRTTLGQEGAKDRLDMDSREPIWAKKVPRID